MLRSGKALSRSPCPRRSITFQRPCGRISHRSYAPRQVGASIPVNGVLVLTQNGIRWQLPQTFILRSSPSGTPSMWKLLNPATALSDRTFVYERRCAGGYGMLSRNFARSSRSAPDRKPSLPSSLTGHSPTRHMVVRSVASTRKRVQVSSSAALQLGSTPVRELAVLTPPYGSPGIPSQW